MFKNALVYRIVHWDPPAAAALAERLSRVRFVECGATQGESAGWIEPRGPQHEALLETVAGQLVLRHCAETRKVPAGAVKDQVEARLATIEQQTGRRPRGKAVRDLKEQIVHALMPRAFPKRALNWVWIDPHGRWLGIDTASAKRADAIVTGLVDLFGGGLGLAPLQTALSPAGAMAGWLLEREPPRAFSVDRDAELRQPDGERPSVRYARHALDTDEVVAHVRQGKVPTQLAMTWSGRVSFLLTEALALKRIQMLDVVTDAASADEAGFDADVAIATGELRLLLPDLIEALGGELEPGAATVTDSPSAEPLAA